MEHASEIALALAVVTPIATWVAAFTSVKVSLNGTRQRVRTIEETVLRMDDKLDKNSNRIATIEERCRLRSQTCPMNRG